MEQLAEVLEGVDRKLVLLIPDAEDVTAFADQLPEHTVLGAGDCAPPESCVLNEVSPDNVAYLLFTSGSTGMSSNCDK